jgi:hypothetical protein
MGLFSPFLRDLRDFFRALDSAAGSGRHVTPHIGTSFWSQALGARAAQAPWYSRTWPTPPFQRTFAPAGADIYALPTSGSAHQLTQNTYTRPFSRFLARFRLPVALPRLQYSRYSWQQAFALGACQTPTPGFLLPSLLPSTLLGGAPDSTSAPRANSMATGSGCTNGLTITRRCHRSRHFCGGDANMCQPRARNALHCCGPRRATDRTYHYAA